MTRTGASANSPALMPSAMWIGRYLYIRLFGAQRLRSDPRHKSREQREAPRDIEVETQSGQKPGSGRGNCVHVRLDQMHDLVAEFLAGRDPAAPRWCESSCRRCRGRRPRRRSRRRSPKHQRPFPRRPAARFPPACGACARAARRRRAVDGLSGSANPASRLQGIRTSSGRSNDRRGQDDKNIIIALASG